MFSARPKSTFIGDISTKNDKLHEIMKSRQIIFLIIETMRRRSNVNREGTPLDNKPQPKLLPLFSLIPQPLTTVSPHEMQGDGG